MCTRQPCFDLSAESDAMRRSVRSPQEELEYFCVPTPSTTLSGSASCSTSRSSSTLASSGESGVSIYPHHDLYNSTFSHTDLSASVDVLDADVYPPYIGVPAVFSLTQPHAHQRPHPPSQHSHSSHSPASYVSYTTTTGSSVDSFPTTGSSIVEYPPVGEKSGSASGSASISGPISSNVGLEAPQGRAGVEMDAAVIVPRRGHGNSASVSTVTGSPTLGTVIAQSGTVTGEPAHQVMGENRLGHGHSHRPTQYVPLAQAPTRGHGQTQAPSHQSRQPHPPIHPQGQISEASHPYRGRTAHATVPRSAQRREQYAAPVLSSSSAPSKAGTSSTVTTTGKRGRAPKRLRASLTGPAVGAGKSGPAGGGGGGDSDDDSDDDEADWDPAGDDGGGHAESSGHGGAGLSGGRK